MDKYMEIELDEEEYQLLEEIKHEKQEYKDMSISQVAVSELTKYLTSKNVTTKFIPRC